MEKLEKKHNHKLTDLLKVAIFGLMLILPGIILLPSMLYYGVNKNATAPTEQVEKIEYENVNFNQLSNPNDIINYEFGDIIYNVKNGIIVIDGTVGLNNSWYDLTTNNFGIIGHIYYARVNNENGAPKMWFTGVPYTYNSELYITCENPGGFYLRLDANETYNNYVCYTQIFDLTQMFGAGNEPTALQFRQWYPKDYYEYTESKHEILEKPTGTYETYTDITSQIQYNWNSLWQQPLFSWTNYTILKQGLDNFTYVFGITQTSYINNLITYELIIVAIYIIIDIVIEMFKWLTHLIGEK